MSSIQNTKTYLEIFSGIWNFSFFEKKFLKESGKQKIGSVFCKIVDEKPEKPNSIFHQLKIKSDDVFCE